MSYSPYPTTLDAGVPVPGYRSPSPYTQPQPLAPQPTQTIQPGDETYTTSIGPDGRPVYHLFRAEKASYRGPQGLIHGIQWIAIDPLYEEPRDIQPASVDWIHQWAKNRRDPREEKLWKEWLRMEEKRRRREEKQYAKEQRDYERDVRQGGRRSRQGSFSGGPVDQFGNSIAQPSYAEAPLMTSGNYLSAAPDGSVPLSRQRRLSQSRGTADAIDMERRMRDMELGDDRRTRRKSFSYDEPPRGYGRERSRERPYDQGSSYGDYPSSEYGSSGRGRYAQSSANDYPGYRNELSANDALSGGNYPPGHILSLNSGVQQNTPLIDRRASPNYTYSGLPTQAPIPISDRPKSPYGVGGLTDRPRSPYAVGPQLTDRPRSPYGAPALLDRPRSPYSGSQALDRPRTPNYSYSGVTGPGYVDAAQRGALVNPTQQQIMFPEAFNRQPNQLGRNLTTFAPFLIAWLDSLAVEMPRLPALLVPHDISHQDWIRFMSDLTSVWTGKTQSQYAYSGSRQPRKSTLAASLIDSWNSAYFIPREVELVLVKGKTRFSGLGAGRSDPILTRAIEDTLNEDLDDSDDDTLSDLDDYYDDTDTDAGYDTGYGFYGSGAKRIPGDDRWMARVMNVRRKWIERQRQDRKLTQRRERQRRERSIRKKYSLYIMSVV